MKYALLIYTADSNWDGVPEDQKQAIYGEYAAVNEAKGVFGGNQLQPVSTATTVRVDDGKTLLTDGPFVDAKEYLAVGGRRSRRRDRGCRSHSGGAHGRGGRGPPHRGAVALIEQVFRDEWGRVLAALISFLGDFDLAEEAAQEAFTLAAERWPPRSSHGVHCVWLPPARRCRRALACPACQRTGRGPR